MTAVSVSTVNHQTLNENEGSQLVILRGKPTRVTLVTEKSIAIRNALIVVVVLVMAFIATYSGLSNPENLGGIVAPCVFGYFAILSRLIWLPHVEGFNRLVREQKAVRNPLVKVEDGPITDVGSLVGYDRSTASERFLDAPEGVVRLIAGDSDYLVYQPVF
jgi:hypothetical protein